MTIQILIIVPAYNEAQNLPHVLVHVRTAVADLQAVDGSLVQEREGASANESVCPHGERPRGQHSGHVDVLIVDDASVDDTAAVAKREGAQVLRLPCNLGYGGAVQTGFKYAVERCYDYAVILDADGQHDPDCIPELLGPVMAGEADLVLGSRFLGSMTYRPGPLRRAGMALFGAIVACFTGQRVTDPTSGFQAMNRGVLRFFARDNYPADYPDADTLLLLHYAGFRVAERPVRMHGRLSGAAMHSGWKVFYYIVKMFLAIFTVFLRRKTIGTLSAHPFVLDVDMITGGASTNSMVPAASPQLGEPGDPGVSR